MFKKSKRGIYLTVAASLLLIVFLVLLPKLLVLWSGMSTTTNSENIAFLISSPTSPEVLASQLEKFMQHPVAQNTPPLKNNPPHKVGSA